jgi:hypothetical protein
MRATTSFHTLLNTDKMLSTITDSQFYHSAKGGVQTVLRTVVPFLGLTMLLASGHWFLIRAYANYCAPPGLNGLIYTWFSTGSPVCQFVNHLQVGLANNFVTIWAAAAAGMVVWLATKLGSTSKAGKNTGD